MIVKMWVKVRENGWVKDPENLKSSPSGVDNSS
jgi:hypothetical protein